MVSFSNDEFLQINNAFCKLFEYSSDEIIGKTAKRLGIFNGKPESEIIRQKLDNYGSIEDYEILFFTKSQKQLKGLYSGKIVNIGNEKYILFFIHDITYVKKAEKILRNHKHHVNEIVNKRVEEFNKKLDHYKLILESANTGILVSRMDGKIIEFNKTFQNFIGYEKDEFQNINIYDLYDDKNDFELVLNELKQNKSISNFRTRFITKQQEVKSILISIGRSENGPEDYLVSIISEVSQVQELVDNKIKDLESISQTGSWEMELPSRKIKVSNQFLKMLGYEQIDSSKSIVELVSERIHPEDLVNVRTTIIEAINNLEPYEIKLRVLFPHDILKYFLLKGKVFIDKNSQPYKQVGIISNITKEIRQELVFSARAKLWELSPNLSIDELLTLTIDETCKLVESPIGFYHFIDEDQQNILLHSWSTKTKNEFCKSRGAGERYPINQAGVWADCIRERKTIIHNDYASLTNKNDLPDDHAEITRELIVPIFKKNIIVAIIGVGNKLTNYDNNDVKIVETIADITWTIVEKKRFEENLLRQSEIISNIPAGVVLTDINGFIEFANPAFIQKSGYEEKELTGKSTKIFKSGKHPSEFYKILWETILSGRTWRGEMYNKYKSGNSVWEYVSISPIKNENGDIVNFVAVKEDITKIKKLNEELNLAKIIAEKSDKLKSEFLTQISHEIRTPINTLLSFANLIKSDINDYLTDDLIESFKHMDSAGKRITRTIDLIIKMSELYTDNYEPIFKVNNLIELLDELVKTYKPIAEDKNIKVIYYKLIPIANVVFDERTIYDVFQNIIDNAVKFTQHGKVTVQVKKTITNNVSVSIIDTGIGISSDYIGQIFSPFTQETNGYTRKYDGNGLGLALVKEYCKLNNAEIYVSSEKGSGSDFTVVFK